MNEARKVQLIDEYDEATLKLFMEKYAESEGISLWSEYETALHNNELPNIPVTFDIRCKEIIRKYAVYNGEKQIENNTK